MRLIIAPLKDIIVKINRRDTIILLFKFSMNNPLGLNSNKYTVKVAMADTSIQKQFKSETKYLPKGIREERVLANENRLTNTMSIMSTFTSALLNFKPIITLPQSSFTSRFNST